MSSHAARITSVPNTGHRVMRAMPAFSLMCRCSH